MIDTCRIEGSSDASIRDVSVNDIHELLKKTKIKAVFTTGGLASKLYRRYVKEDVPHYALPSTSAANARMRMDDLLAHYRRITEVLYEKA